MSKLSCAVAALALGAAMPAYAQEDAPGIQIETGGKLRLTRGISTIEGQAGGGLTPWALITGDETDRGIGGTAHVSAVKLPDYSFLSYGVGVGLFDRLELTYTRQEFDTEDVGAALGFGQGFTFGQDVWGAKVRVAGDALYDQGSWLPQIALVANWKQNDQGAVINAIGGIDDGDPVAFTVDAFPGERFQGSVVQVRKLGARTGETSGTLFPLHSCALSGEAFDLCNLGRQHRGPVERADRSQPAAPRRPRPCGRRGWQALPVPVERRPRRAE